MFSQNSVPDEILPPPLHVSKVTLTLAFAIKEQKMVLNVSKGKYLNVQLKRPPEFNNLDEKNREGLLCYPIPVA